jgi:hypothetical protein
LEDSSPKNVTQTVSLRFESQANSLLYVLDHLKDTHYNRSRYIEPIEVIYEASAGVKKKMGIVVV